MVKIILELENGDLELLRFVLDILGDMNSPQYIIPVPIEEYKKRFRKIRREL